jgi:hypothetical protein
MCQVLIVIYMSDSWFTKFAEEYTPNLPAHITKNVMPGKYIRITNEMLSMCRSLYFVDDAGLYLKIMGKQTTRADMVDRINRYIGKKPTERKGRTRSGNDALFWSIEPSMLDDLIRIVHGLPSLDEPAEQQIVQIIENPKLYSAEVVDTAHKLSAYPQSGFVYAAKSTDPLHPDIVKLGATRQPRPEDRLKTLNNSSVVYDYELIASYWVACWLEAENKVHNYYTDQRIRSDREFFSLTIEQRRNLDFTAILGE